MYIAYSDRNNYHLCFVNDSVKKFAVYVFCYKLAEGHHPLITGITFYHNRRTAWSQTIKISKKNL